MPAPAMLAVSALLAYLIGALPFGYWFVRFSAGKDIRMMGSGNIGATNVHRSLGRKAGLVVLLLDVLKGFAAIWLTALLTQGDPRALAASAVAVMLGHCYPVFLKFHGGKAVACFIGAFLYLAPLALALVAGIFFAVVFFTRYISLGSILGALLFPVFVWATEHPSNWIVWSAVAAAILIIYRHKANIVRLRNGTEHVFTLKGKTA